MNRTSAIPLQRRYFSLSLTAFSSLLALANTVLFNAALATYVTDNLDLLTPGGASIASSILIVVLLVNFLFFTFVSLISPRIATWIFAASAPVSAFALYYLISYQVVLDKTMLGNILNTRISEAADFLTPTAGLTVLLLGLLPGYLVLRLRVQPLGRLRLIAVATLVSLLGIGFLYFNSASSLWIDKYSSVLGGKFLPWSYVVNAVRYQVEKSRSRAVQSPLPDGNFADNDPVVVVLVIGETARAANFSLYGYERDTNPRLAATQNLSVFKPAEACTTYTTGSLACILAQDDGGHGDEPLTNYLTRLGGNVSWRSNNWGEPPQRVSYYQKASELRPMCLADIKNDSDLDSESRTKHCQLDEVLLTGLEQHIRSETKPKKLIVLHTKGSHGPSYYERYPAEFERFTPVCRSEDISRCTQQQLINAYDNSILYTDYFLDRVLRNLRELGDIPVMMIYVSDHGESLGEGGLYLHGTPKLLAPAYQIEVPFLVWRSPAMIARQNLTDAFQPNTENASHANVFHTIVGALGLQTPVYDPALDLYHNDAISIR